MDKLVVELQDGYFVESDSLNYTLRQRYAGQDKDGGIRTGKDERTKATTDWNRRANDETD